MQVFGKCAKHNFPPSAGWSGGWGGDACQRPEQNGSKHLKWLHRGQGGVWKCEPLPHKAKSNPEQGEAPEGGRRMGDPILPLPSLLRCWQAGASHPTRLEPTVCTMDTVLAAGDGHRVLPYLQLSLSVLTRSGIESLRGRTTSQPTPLASVRSDPGISFMLAVDECLAVTEKNPHSLWNSLFKML